MTRLDRQVNYLLALLIAIAASLVTATAMHDWDQGVSAEQKEAPYVRPLDTSKMIEIYERAFYASATTLPVEQRHKFAMGAVQTAPSRYNQLMMEIAKHDPK